MSDGPVYAIRSIDYAYPRSGGETLHAIHGLSLEIQPGTLVGLLGPNGSGKSTLLKCLLGLLVPQQGQILLDDVSINRYSPRRLSRIIGYVPQETQPAFDFTVRQVVLMGRSPHMGRFGFESRQDYTLADECLAQTDATHLADRLFDELSSGERQRVVIARALAQQPRILLLDEPTSFLDLAHQLQIYRVLRRLVGQGLTVVCISHDLNMAAQFDDDLVLLQCGRIAARGTPEQVLTADNVRDVYGVAAEVTRHPRTHRPLVLPLPGEDASAARRAPVT